MTTPRARWRPLLVAGTVCLLTFFVAGLTSQTGSSDSSTRPAAADQVPSSLFDQYPGFGQSVEASRRDDAIAYWEAWRRDSVISSCMSSAGFEWTPEVLFPEESIVAVSEFLGLSLSGTSVAGTDNEKVNRSYAASLSKQKRDGYYRALYGETADAVDYVEAHGGEVPPGVSAESFAKGGCRGRAWAEIGSLWALRDQLADELESLDVAARQTDAFKAAVKQFVDCAAARGVPVESPAELDNPKLDPGLTGVVARECNSYWVKARAAGHGEVDPAFLAKHADKFESQSAHYAPAIEQAKADASFVEYLRGQAERVSK